MHIWKRIHKPRPGWKIEESATPAASSATVSQPTPRLQIIRKLSTKYSTIGDMYFDGKYICKTLEDAWRDPNNSGQLDEEEKIFGETCIPTGTYRVVWTRSPRFGTETPEILDVPFYEGIRIHWGNFINDTLGCPITGLQYGENVVYRSRQAYARMENRIKDALINEKIYIEVTNKFGDKLETYI